MVKKIWLCGERGRGLAVLVDEADYERLNRYRWYLLKGSGYAVRTTPRPQHKTVYMHREVITDVGPGMEVDHINRNRLDNRRANLRVASRSLNAQNLTPRTDGSSRHRNVHWCTEKQRWVVKVRLNGRRHYVGSFTDEETAGRAAENSRRQLFDYAVD